MIVVVHPIGNANVRAVLTAFHDAGLLAKFVTSLGYPRSSVAALPAQLRRMFDRRAYDLDARLIRADPLRELLRLTAPRFGFKGVTRHELGWASMDEVWCAVDRDAAKCLETARNNPAAVYAYEDCAEATFTAAQQRDIRRVYDLPIAYWKKSRELLAEEAQRYPEWEPTLIGTRDSESKLARKTRELELAEMVVCPSNFVLESLPEDIRRDKQCFVVPFGSPPVTASVERSSKGSAPLRVLFAGAMTQRKGLADLFAAMKLLGRSDVQLVVMGSLLQPIAWYRAQYPDFIYEAPRPHAEVLHLMSSCDVLVMPSIVEGRALVQQEAMSRGLPVIATRNAGADDVIIDGKTGFIVPARSPEVIAEKIGWFAANREALAGMGIAAQTTARELTWSAYGATIVGLVRDLINCTK